MKELWRKFKSLFKPKQIAETIYEIDYLALRSKGFNTLILDIDDTLIPRTVNDVYPEVLDWVTDRKSEGFKLCLTSNSRHPMRVKYFADILELPAIHLGFKPLPFAFWRSLDLVKSKPEESVMIGDQLFMDILGANLVKIYSIYVKHITKETFFLRQLMRMAEEWILR